ncbi:MAG TPA: YbaB/EbfC family nucleoid-associated protein [Coxiellaceae bacterium]|nr:YbaB/EbfC family nucleoid-associated protein [Coxiellaceae bacterium]
MFDQLKDLYKLKKQADEMQRQLAQEQVSGQSKNGAVTITLDGTQEVKNVSVSTEAQLTAQQMETDIKQALDDAQHKLKSLLAEKFRGMM